jgi:hypothetical protein
MPHISGWNYLRRRSESFLVGVIVSKTRIDFTRQMLVLIMIILNIIVIIVVFSCMINNIYATSKG